MIPTAMARRKRDLSIILRIEEDGDEMAGGEVIEGRSFHFKLAEAEFKHIDWSDLGADIYNAIKVVLEKHLGRLPTIKIVKDPVGDDKDEYGLEEV